MKKQDFLPTLSGYMGSAEILRQNLLNEGVTFNLPQSLQHVISSIDELYDSNDTFYFRFDLFAYNINNILNRDNSLYRQMPEILLRLWCCINLSHNQEYVNSEASTINMMSSMASSLLEILYSHPNDNNVNIIGYSSDDDLRWIPNVQDVPIVSNIVYNVIENYNEADNNTTLDLDENISYRAHLSSEALGYSGESSI
jgi:hypothetical protein